MKFSVRISDHRPIFDLFQLVYASGEITFGDAEKLQRICEQYKFVPGGHFHIDSKGGNLLEGMKLGTIIRNWGFNTYIARKSQKNNDIAYCVSAATFAYLGGLHRYISPNALFGVHQFSNKAAISTPASSLKAGQEISRDILKYIIEMGADPRLFYHIVSAPPDDINWISHDDLRALNVVNEDVLKQEWEIKLIEGIPTLRGHQLSSRGEHKLFIHASPKGDLVFVILFGTAYLTEVVEEWASIHLRLDHEMYEINSLISPPSVMNDYVSYIFLIPPYLIENLKKATFIGAATQPPNKDIYSGFDMNLGDHRDKLSQIVRAAEVNRETQSAI